MSFARELLEEAGSTLPSGVVVDVGWIEDAEEQRRLAVIEANMGWFSDRYHGDPERVLDVVMRSAGPAADVLPQDRPFVRRPT